MRYKRDEVLRFTFGEPISAFFSIIEVNGKALDTSEGEAKVIDLSPKGMKLNTYLEIPVSKKSKVKISVRFSLNENEYMLNGEIKWKKVGTEGFLYGIQFSADEDMEKILMEELKIFVRSLTK